MQEPNEAKFAFKKLAYNNFKHHPLYLEWAPENVFDGTPDEEEPSPEVGEEEPFVEDNSTLFVKNLNFKTTEQDLRAHFANIGKVYTSTIATRKSSDGFLSMGYGFVQYYLAKHALEALKKLQNSTLDDHKLELKLSNRTVNKYVLRGVASFTIFIIILVGLKSTLRKIKRNNRLESRLARKFV